MSLSTDMHDALSELIIGMDEAVAPFRFDKLLYITLPPLSLSKDIVGFKGCWKHSPDGGYWKNEIPKNEDLAVTRELSSTLSALFIDKPLSVSDADKDITMCVELLFGSQYDKSCRLYQCYGPGAFNGIFIYSQNSDTLSHASESLSDISSFFQNLHFKVSKKTMSQEFMTVKVSPREKQVLKGMAAGLNYEKIGTCLGISPFTVRAYSRALGLKLNCNDRAAIILRALALNLI